MSLLSWFAKLVKISTHEVKEESKPFTPKEATEEYQKLDFVGEKPPAWFVDRLNEILKVKSTNNRYVSIWFSHLSNHSNDQVRKWVIYFANYGWDIDFYSESQFTIRPSRSERGEVKYS